MSNQDNFDKQESFEVRDIRQKGWFWLDNEFFNGYVKILGPDALAIYVSLCRHADKQQKAYPSIKTISLETNISPNYVIYNLELLNYFRIIKKVRVGKTVNNRYYLLDKKHWRTDWEVMLKDLTSRISELKGVKFSIYKIALQKLKDCTSSSKKTICNKTNSNNGAAQKNAPLGAHFLPATEHPKPESENLNPEEENSIRENENKVIIKPNGTDSNSREWPEWSPENEKLLRETREKIKQRSKGVE